MWLGGRVIFGAGLARDQQDAGSNPGHRAVECNPGQVVHTRASVTKQQERIYRGPSRPSPFQAQGQGIGRLRPKSLTIACRHLESVRLNCRLFGVSHLDRLILFAPQCPQLLRFLALYTTV